MSYFFSNFFLFPFYSFCKNIQVNNLPSYIHALLISGIMHILISNNHPIGVWNLKNCLKTKSFFTLTTRKRRRLHIFCTNKQNNWLLLSKYLTTSKGVQNEKRKKTMICNQKTWLLLMNTKTIITPLKIVSLHISLLFSTYLFIYAINKSVVVA